MTLKNYLIVILIICFVFPLFSCDMIAVAGSIDINELQAAIRFFKNSSNSKSNNDGYGIAWFDDNQSWQTRYKCGKRRWYGDGDSEPLNELTDMADRYIVPGNVVMMHARDASSGFGNHPFTLKMNNKTWAFMHNGTLSLDLQEYFLESLGDDWFDKNHPNWTSDPKRIIDSEIFFHYLVSEFERQQSLDIILIDLMDHIAYAGNKEILNFILSDGEIFFAFRNSPLSDKKHKLCFKQKQNMVIISTGTQQLEELKPRELIIFQSGKLNRKQL